MEPLDLEGTRRINDRPYGRVSHISKYRVPKDRKKTNDALEHWRNNFRRDHPELPDPAEPNNFYSLRGTYLHAGIEHFLTTGEQPDLHEWAKPFWPHAHAVIKKFKHTYWAEKPLEQPDTEHPWPHSSVFQFLTPDNEIRHHIYHPAGYCGTPDHIGHYRFKTTLTDFKTSNVPYQSRPHFGKIQNDPVKEKERKALVNGYYKFKRTVIQLAAYTHAIEHMLGYPGWIQQGHIAVFVQPDLNRPYDDLQGQSLLISRQQLDVAYIEFLANLEAWKTEHGLNHEISAPA